MPNWRSMPSVLARWFFTLAVILPTTARAQAFNLSGRVADRIARVPVPGASVTLDDARTIVSDSAGEFRFSGVRKGSHVLQVRAFGYAPTILKLDVASDTTLVISLVVTPVSLDSLRIDSRLVTVTGRLLERVTKIPVMDGAIYAADKNTRSDRDGRFRFKRVQAGIPFDIHVLAFSFEPIRVTILPGRDTALILELDPDTSVQRLIREQEKRLEKRMVDAIGRGYSLSRESLLRFRGGTLKEVLAWNMKYAPYSTPKARVCAFVDEGRAAALDPESFLVPEEIERVEYFFDGAMIRIYTRRFMAHLVTGDLPLEKPGHADVPRGLSRQHAVQPAMCK